MCVFLRGEACGLSLPVSVDVFYTVHSGNLGSTDTGPCRLQAHPIQVQLGDNPEWCILDWVYLHRWSFDTVSCRLSQLRVHNKGLDPQTPAISNAVILCPFLSPTALMGSCACTKFASQCLSPRAEISFATGSQSQSTGKRDWVSGLEAVLLQGWACSRIAFQDEMSHPLEVPPLLVSLLLQQVKIKPLSGPRCKDKLSSALGLPGSDQPSFQVGHTLVGVTWSGLFLELFKTWLFCSNIILHLLHPGLLSFAVKPEVPFNINITYQKEANEYLIHYNTPHSWKKYLKDKLIHQIAYRQEEGTWKVSDDVLGIHWFPEFDIFRNTSIMSKPINMHWYSSPAENLERCDIWHSEI